MINGFFEPHEMVGKTGCKVADTPLGKALKGLFNFFCFYLNDDWVPIKVSILANLSERHFFLYIPTPKVDQFLFFLSHQLLWWPIVIGLIVV